MQRKNISRKHKQHVQIPEEYINGAFFVFLYIETGNNDPHIFCFSTKDIKNRWKLRLGKNNKKFYYLGFRKSTISNHKNKSNLREFLFDNKHIVQIKETIKRSVSRNEMEMFRLIKKQQDLISMKDETHRLENWINEKKNAEILIENKRKEIEILKNKYTDTLAKVGTHLPGELKERIAFLLGKNISVDKVIKQIRDIIPVDITERILEEYILQFMVID